jgi:cobalt/nickel transport system permease protein
MQIDTLAYTNRLRHLPPSHKLGFAGLALALAYAAPVAIQVLIALWLGVWIVVYAGVPIGTYLKLLALPMGFLLTSLPAIVLGFGEGGADVAWGLPMVYDPIGNHFIYISLQGLQQALTLGARSLAVTSCVFFIMLTIPFVDLLDILRRCKVPTLLIELMLLMYRFIFTLLRTSQQLWIAQHSRNGYRTGKLGLRSVGILAGQLLQRSLINYRQVSLSLASRGFTGEFRVWHSRQYRGSWRYGLEAVGGCMMLAGLIGRRYVGI